VWCVGKHKCGAWASKGVLGKRYLFGEHKGRGNPAQESLIWCCGQVPFDECKQQA